jgi:hypothetical protein
MKGGRPPSLTRQYLYMGLRILHRSFSSCRPADLSSLQNSM